MAKINRYESLKRILIATIIISLIIIFIAYLAGFYNGVRETISWGVQIVKHYTNITIDEKALTDGIYQYQERIGGCIGVDPVKP